MFHQSPQCGSGGPDLAFCQGGHCDGRTGRRPRRAWLGEAGYLTNETVFSLTERPARLGVIGGGPIGCELAQTFQRLGAQVTLLHRGAHLFNKEDADAAEIVQQAMLHDGVQLALEAQLRAVERRGAAKVLQYTDAAGQGCEQRG